MTDLGDALVRKGGLPAAVLQRVDGGTEFSYRPDYLEGPGIPVATSLPVSREALRTSGGAVPPFFAGLLPEGRRLTAVRVATKTAADDELGLLLAVGADAIGDVSVEPLTGERAQPVPAALQLPRDLSTVSVRELLRGQDFDRVALPGVQDKVSGQMINLPAERAGQRLVVKLDPPEFPHVVRNEAAFLRLAREAGLVTPGWKLLTDAEGADVLAVARFDRPENGEPPALAQEDASQVLKIWPADKYRPTAEAVVLALAEQCASRRVAAKTLYEQLVFAVVTGNGDQHAKNLSILADTGQREWRVSPAYDLPSTAVYGDTTTALSIDGTRRGVSRKKILRFADRIGLPERVAVRSLDRILARTAPVLRDVSMLDLPYDPQRTRSWQRELDYRRRLLDTV